MYEWLLLNLNCVLSLLFPTHLGQYATVWGLSEKTKVHYQQQRYRTQDKGNPLFLLYAYPIFYFELLDQEMVDSTTDFVLK